jgi:sortase (surface protein transpeptidase)
MDYVDINLLRSKTSFNYEGLIFDGQISDYQPEEKIVSFAKLPKESVKTKVSRGLKRLSMVLLSMGVLSTSAVIFPQVSEFVDEKLSSSYVQIFTKPTKTFGDNLMASGDKKPVKPYQPTYDTTLGEENRLIIDEIGVDALLGESGQESVEEALREGVWRVSEFGTPYARKRPTILAAHRFGFLDWTNEFRRTNSFYNLPKLNEGDTVEIVWAHRKYIYEVYGIEEGAEILDYQADLILYTCKFLDAETRVFVYAKLLEI